MISSFHGKIVKISQDQLIELIEFAFEFEIEALNEVIKKQIEKSTIIENCCLNVAICKKFKMQELLTDSVEPILFNNFSKAIKSNGFLLWDFETLKDYANSDKIIIESELDVFRSILEWAKHDYRERKPKLKDIL